MNNKPLVFLALASALALAACAEPQPRPAPDAVATQAPATNAPANQPQNTNPDGKAGPAGAAPVDAAVRDKVMVLLSGIEHIPSKEEFARAGSDDQVVAALDSIVRDPEAKIRFRTGAVAALGLYPRPDTRKTFEALLSDPATKEQILRPAIKAYAAAFGPDAVPLLSKQLNRDDRNTREAAMRSLADVGGPSARQAVEARSKVETDEALKKLSLEALARWKLAGPYPRGFALGARGFDAGPMRPCTRSKGATGGLWPPKAPLHPPCPPEGEHWGRRAKWEIEAVGR